MKLLRNFFKKTGSQNLFLDHPKSPKMCNFWRFFGFFSKNRIEILSLNCQNVEEIDSEQTQKTADLILFKKLRYLTLKPSMDGPKSKKSSNFAYKNPAVGPITWK